MGYLSQMVTVLPSYNFGCIPNSETTCWVVAHQSFVLPLKGKTWLGSVYSSRLRLESHSSKHWILGVVNGVAMPKRSTSARERSTLHACRKISPIGSAWAGYIANTVCIDGMMCMISNYSVLSNGLCDYRIDAYAAY